MRRREKKSDVDVEKTWLKAKQSRVRRKVIVDPLPHRPVASKSFTQIGIFGMREKIELPNVLAGFPLFCRYGEHPGCEQDEANPQGNRRPRTSRDESCHNDKGRDQRRQDQKHASRTRSIVCDVGRLELPLRG